MRSDRRTKGTRRELFADLGRFLAAGGLLLAGALAMRGGDKEAECAGRLPCGNCRMLDRCARPEADSARRNQARRKS